MPLIYPAQDPQGCFGAEGDEWVWDGVSPLRIPALVWEAPPQPIPQALETSERRSKIQVEDGRRSKTGSLRTFL